MRVRLASRGSQLALWQAEHVRGRILALHPGAEVEIRIVRTTGDRVTDVPLWQVGDRALFTKEVDQAVLDGEADAAVHSFKDLPTETPEGLVIAAVLSREDPRDAFVPAPGAPRRLADLPRGARVGTSSVRRKALLKRRRPDLEIRDLRGNLDTRLARLEAGDFDAIVLAAAGIRRLGRESVTGELLEPPGWLPAAGQGALAVAVRADDEATRRLVQPLDDPDTRDATTAERAFLAELEGGCQVPIGVLASVVGSELRVAGLVSDLEGSTVVRGETSGPRHAAAEVGRALARELLSSGAADILAAIRGTDPRATPAEAP